MENQEINKICQLCKKHKKKSELLPLELIDPELFDFIKEKYPDCSDEGYICKSDLSLIKLKYVEEVLRKEKGEITALEEKVFNSIKEQETIARNVNIEFEEQLTTGQKLSDKIAAFGGSWKFIMIFFVIIIVWMVINSFVLANSSFDPYPYILLNLILSCLAALQAPIIMMSQNRLESKDRLRSRNDYIVNLKAELEIKNLNEKMDNLLGYQWQRLMEIQKIQTDIMNELSERSKKKNP
ncbi:MAG TPA: DUF1003 domain-containing protein [Candidatus Humimicrobiaceae bacterium]